MPNQTEDRSQGLRELTVQELEAISGGWIGHFTAILVRNTPAKSVGTGSGMRNDDCGCLL